jgi:murein DD-endopeptidase MepM/ murein hydrolase activator NlpD
MPKIVAAQCRPWWVVALATTVLASCTTYKPLGQGSQVPWAKYSQGSQPMSVAQADQPRPLQLGSMAVRPARAPVVVSSLPAPAPAPAPLTTPAPAPVVVAAVEPAARPEPAPVAAAQPSEAASRGPGQHRVMRGEHLGAIAQRYGVSLEGLAQANDLASPYVIHVGQVLQIPDGAEVEPRRYVVARGDTLSGIAERFDVAAADVAAANGIASPYQLSVGQRLEIPGTQTVRAVPDAAPPPLTGDGFLWPVDGKLIGKFGATGDGQRRNGVNIAARKGAPVVASEDGIVVYASDGIHGYGRMILVRHAEGYITTYAHNAALLVEVGDVVRRGQVIARVGDTGDVSQSQLHFELRKGTKAINPEAVLVRQSTAVASTS